MKTEKPNHSQGMKPKEPIQLRTDGKEQPLIEDKSSDKKPTKVINDYKEAIFKEGFNSALDEVEKTRVMNRGKLDQNRWWRELMFEIKEMRK